MQSRLERVQECVAQLRIGMAIQSAEHVREMESLGSAMLGPQALLDEFDGARVTRPQVLNTRSPHPLSLAVGSVEGVELEARIEEEQRLVWKPIVDAEHEYARTRAAVAVDHARREIQDSAMKRCAEMNESLKSALASATERRDAANRAFPRRPPSISFFSSGRAPLAGNRQGG